MRCVQLIIAMLVSSSVMGQAFHCGMFGILQDDYGTEYVGRFDDTMDYVFLESAESCNVVEVPITVWDVVPRKRYTKVFVDFNHPDFDDTAYLIRYPTGAWNIVKERATEQKKTMSFFPGSSPITE